MRTAPANTMTSQRGLANVGNTCYLNSAIQALRHVRPFATLFSDDAWKKWEHPERKGHALAKTTAAIVRGLTDDEGPRYLVPREFAGAFIKFASDINEEIRYGAQADAAEAIQILLDGLHTQIAREVRMEVTGKPINDDHAAVINSLESWATFFRKEYSPLVDAFYGQNATTVVCACGGTSTRYEPWSVLKLAIPGAERAGAPAPTLQECFRGTMADEELDDYACDACKQKTRATIRHSISRFPNHIVLSLKRFTNHGAKVRARIPYDPDLIDLRELCAWPTLQGAQRYHVIATVEHMGGSRGGHYVMRARSPSNKWSVYDDSQVSPDGLGGAAGPDTYILILQKL
jgi:ubiquitin C-terminal hydrolase